MSVTIPHEDCRHESHLRAFGGIYCYTCGKFLGKYPEEVARKMDFRKGISSRGSEYPKTQETWHDRPPML